ncbi:putative dipeptidyl-aminopeptidase B [Polychaeton citri CBS 116435]|uniref:dipeptidyl-peptidase IV n=1 Tax=Polychaeton citri CBS 116435 TaxID=1314669 RepID=A0A9P4QGF0_9PEZI|nr:putative dipeptidyl-aminopeptidase B [Polychaeton citri CBS 116435]
MARNTDDLLGEQSEPLTSAHRRSSSVPASREPSPHPSTSSISTRSLVLDHISDRAAMKAKEGLYSDDSYYSRPVGKPEDRLDLEDQLAWQRQLKPADRKFKRILVIVVGVAILGWIAALGLFLQQDRHATHSSRPHDPHATSTVGNGKKITLEQVLTGQWYERKHAIEWIAGPDGQDGLLLERGGADGRDYLVVEDVRYRGENVEIQKQHSTTLMKSSGFQVGNEFIVTHEAWPSADHNKVLVESDKQSNWRHSDTGRYWLFDVASQTGEPLDPDHVDGRIQFAKWSPQSDAVAFVRENDLYMRHLDSKTVTAITEDGGPDTFYGIADWVYEEEILQTGEATWWSADGNFLAYFKTDESQVPEFPVQYFFSRPSGLEPKKGEENYPEVRQIKYPKAGAPNPVVKLELYDVKKGESFSVKIEDDFPDYDRLLTEVVWCGKTGKVLVRETNRESDILKTILIDAEERSGRTVRERDVQKLDGGWFETTHTTRFLPADPESGRMEDGYIDTVIHEGYDHLAYFSPLNNSEPTMLTEGEWEVVHAPSAVDELSNLVYFIGTKAGSTQRHVYTVDITLGPGSVKAVTDTNAIGYYAASFSDKGTFMLLSYDGPGIPWQRVKETPSNKMDHVDILVEDNKNLHELAQKHELPIEIYQEIEVDGVKLNVVERRPPHFDESGKRKYPVLFYLYNGPGFQQVDRRFSVDFQAYVAASLGYVVVTVDGRGTGYKGRAHRCIVRGNIGYWEAHDQIAAAKMWAAKKYVDANRLAIWGWSYGGFMTLKVLETDAGETFRYGMAVAPVTDWRYYDSVYTERYMHTPQHNPSGYDNATVSNATALAQNSRFLVMHGYSDDNVHFQNTLALLDKLDLANALNYDVHVFPDSDHGIYFHNGNRVVYEKLRAWLVNAFNGAWEGMADPEPKNTWSK